jgi:CDGSH-type Zn-finger protein
VQKNRKGAIRVRIDAEGPVVVDGPVEVSLGDGCIVRSERFAVAICTCRRSRSYPWCDTSHRPRNHMADRRNITEAGRGEDRRTDGTGEEQ